MASSERAAAASLGQKMKRTRKIKIVAVAQILVLSAGCATVKEGLVGEEHENIAPFTEVTINFLGAREVDFRESDMTYLRQYVQDDAPEIRRLRELLHRVDEFTNAIVMYSLELVRISEAYQTEGTRVSALVNSIETEFSDSLLNRVNVSPQEFDRILDAARQEDSLLGALRAIQPLIVMNGEAFEDILNEIDAEAMPAARQRIDAAIQEEFSTVISQLDVIYGRRDELMRGLQMIHAYQKGDQDALRPFVPSQVVLVQKYQLPLAPSDEQLEATKAHLIAELHRENEILDLLEQDVDDYVATRKEFDHEMNELAVGLAATRREAIGWIRGHQALADGVKDPGKWMKAFLDVTQSLRRVR